MCIHMHASQSAGELKFEKIDHPETRLKLTLKCELTLCKILFYQTF